MSNLTSKFSADSNMTITSVYGLSAPPISLVKAREKKVAACIRMMGDRYVLAKKVGKKS